MEITEKSSIQSVSVCMATFNGEAFVVEQIESILNQLKPSDELIIVDDCSTDSSVSLMRNINDPRIKIQQNSKNEREISSFCKAIRSAGNDIIFLSDQDDIWIPGRISMMLLALNESGASVVASNFNWINTFGESINIKVDGVRRHNSERYLNNILDIFIGKTNYYGCAMALRRDFALAITPIPRYVESHDLWIALASNIARSNVHTEEITLHKRQHRNNATSPVSTRKLYKKIWSRIIFVASMWVLKGKLKNKRWYLAERNKI